MTFQEWLENYRRNRTVHRMPPRTCLYLTDKATGDDVEIVSENLEVKAEPVKEKTRGNQ